MAALKVLVNLIKDKEIDFQSDELNYSEFLIASLRDQITDEKVRVTFRYFDLDDAGYLSRNVIEEALSNLGI